ALLLFNAGIGLKTNDLKGLFLRPKVVAVGMLANIAVPLLLVMFFRGVMHISQHWTDLQNLLVGLAIVVSMPIAGSSTAWAQNANGNLGLSLGLVLISTILSPLTCPIVMRIFGL